MDRKIAVAIGIGIGITIGAFLYSRPRKTNVSKDKLRQEIEDGLLVARWKTHYGKNMLYDKNNTWKPVVVTPKTSWESNGVIYIDQGLLHDNDLSVAMNSRHTAGEVVLYSTSKFGADVSFLLKYNDVPRTESEIVYSAPHDALSAAKMVYGILVEKGIMDAGHEVRLENPSTDIRLITVGKKGASWSVDLTEGLDLKSLSLALNHKVIKDESMQIHAEHNVNQLHRWPPMGEKKELYEYWQWILNSIETPVSQEIILGTSHTEEELRHVANRVYDILVDKGLMTSGLDVKVNLKQSPHTALITVSEKGASTSTLTEALDKRALSIIYNRNITDDNETRPIHKEHDAYIPDNWPPMGSIDKVYNYWKWILDSIDTQEAEIVLASNDEVDSEEYKGYRIVTYGDYDCESPHDIGENLVTIWSFNRDFAGDNKDGPKKLYIEKFGYTISDNDGNTITEVNSEDDDALFSEEDAENAANSVMHPSEIVFGADDEADYSVEISSEEKEFSEMNEKEVEHAIEDYEGSKVLFWDTFNYRRDSLTTGVSIDEAIGVYFVTEETAKKLGVDKEYVAEQARNEIKVYSEWGEGASYRIVVYDPEGEETDIGLGCVIGSDELGYQIKEMKETIARIVKIAGRTTIVTA